MKFFKRLGIDLGTANSIVYVAGVGIVLNEPTVVAVAVDDRTVLAVGNEAKEMLGRTPGNIIATRPMRDGVIADYVVTEAMLKYFIRKAMGKFYLWKPEVMICVPAGCTQVERRAVMDAALQAGARKVFLIDEPLAAAVGAGLPIGEAGGNMIVDIGGGAAEAAVISLGGVVVHNSARIGGNKLDEAIANHIKKHHNLIIGDQTAEWVKIKIGDAIGEDKTTVDDSDQLDDRRLKIEDSRGRSKIEDRKSRADQSTLHPLSSTTTFHHLSSIVSAKQHPSSIVHNLSSIEVKGRDAINGLPRTVTVSPKDVTEAIRPRLMQIISVIKSVLEQVPPELSSDIIDRGIVMTGGTSLLKNFPKLVTLETGVPAYAAEDAILCVAKGTGIALENFESYKRAITSR